MNELLGNRIRNLRESLNLTQEYVAIKLNMSRQRYARLEKGINDISFDFIQKVAEILKVDIDAITSAVKNIQPRIAFRNSTGSTTSSVMLDEMLDLFYANKRLFQSVHLEEK